MTATTQAKFRRGVIADTAATAAALALDCLQTKRAGWYVVFLDEERRLWDLPRLLRDKPIKPEGGRTGSGLTRNLQSAVSRYMGQRFGPATYYVFHWLKDGAHGIGAEDKENVRRWMQDGAPRTNGIEIETPEAWASKRATEHPWSMVFFEDMICLWADGTFESVRAARG